jgi:ribosomal protein L11 methylase PrmA
MKKIKIILTIKIAGQENVMTCLIADGVMLTRYSDDRQGKLAYEQAKKNEDFVKYENGVLKQLYPGKTAKEIRDYTMKNLSDTISMLKQKGIPVMTDIKEAEVDTD